MSTRIGPIMGTAIAAVLLVTAAALAQKPGVRPVATIRQIMEGIVVPASDALFQVSDAPTADAEWAGIERQAAVLAESANLMLIGDRVPDAAWSEEAQRLLDRASAAATAARERKFDQLLEASDGIAETCVTCHAGYLGK